MRMVLKTKNRDIAAFFALLRAGLWEDVMVNGEGLMVNGSPLTISNGVDWNKVLDLAEEQSVVGLLAAGIEHVVEAALQTKDDENIKWVIVGDGRKFEWVKEFVKSHGLERTVLLMGRYPVEYMSGFFKQADVMLVCLKDTEIFRLTAPAKIQAYMAVGKPILAMLNGEGAKFSV